MAPVSVGGWLFLGVVGAVLIYIASRSPSAEELEREAEVEKFRAEVHRYSSGGRRPFPWEHVIGGALLASFVAAACMPLSIWNWI